MRSYRDHPLLQAVRRLGDRCAAHDPDPCHCLAIERLTPREREQVQMAWTDQYVTRAVAERRHRTRPRE